MMTDHPIEINRNKRTVAAPLLCVPGEVLIVGSAQELPAPIGKLAPPTQASNQPFKVKGNSLGNLLTVS
jgi:hypothetical protein